jgi:hypothetical protein
MRRTRGSETSQYPEEEKSKEIPLVAASERGEAQTDPNTKQTVNSKKWIVSSKGPDVKGFFLLTSHYLLLSVCFVLGLG